MSVPDVLVAHGQTFQNRVRLKEARWSYYSDGKEAVWYHRIPEDKAERERLMVFAKSLPGVWTDTQDGGRFGVV